MYMHMHVYTHMCIVMCMYTINAQTKSSKPKTVSPSQLRRPSTTTPYPGGGPGQAEEAQETRWGCGRDATWMR